MNHQDDERAFMEALAELANSTREISITMTAFDAFCVLAHIQLAARHPGNNGPTCRIATKVAREIQDRLGPEGSDLGRLIERGWHQCFDG